MPTPRPAPVLVLASRSPRRAKLLREAGYTFTVAALDPSAEPPLPARGCATVLAVELAAVKARKCADALQLQGDAGPCVILAADTIVVSPDDELLGQPVDEADARRMLLSLAGRVHRVVTGVSLLDPATGRVEPLVDEAGVHVGPLDPPTLEPYLASNAWRGKAGAYNLDELQHWPIQVEGDPTTVVGLPMEVLTPALDAWGVVISDL